ncbi:MAG: RNA polymerase sigma factor RpoD, partial [Burkholderiaceae bacterium]|nr:RNA polymerase sigma factor RpoD [Burkholderiaceae bacterium]
MPAKKSTQPAKKSTQPAKAKTAAKPSAASAKPVPKKASPVSTAKKAPAKTVAKPVVKPVAKTAAKPPAKTAAKPAAKAVPVKAAAKPSAKTPAKAPVKPSAEKAKPPKATAKAATKGKAVKKGLPEDADLVDLEAEFAEETVASGEKVKPLRMKISKAKERALMKEFGLDEAVLSEEDLAKRRSRLKTLIKMGKTRGYLTHGEISDHLPDKLVDAETMEVVITMLNDMGVQVYEQTPDAETLLITNTGPTVASEEEAEEEAEAALSTVDSEFGRTTDPVRMYMREMGTVELLTREGEIEIAKRIEGGLMAMMEAISASPATVAEILRMAEDIREGKVVI